MISLPGSLSRDFFPHAFTSKVLRSINTESSHLLFYPLPSGWEKVIFLQGTKRIQKVSTVCEYFRRSAEVVISRMPMKEGRQRIFPLSMASYRRRHEKSR
jgi:hypothetical protein